MLNDVNWKALADQLNLQKQVASIQDICHREIDIRPCYFREVVSRYLDSQPIESCDNTRRKIAEALKKLGYVNKASLLMGGELLPMLFCNVLYNLQSRPSPKCFKSLTHVIIYMLISVFSSRKC